jgi:iron complex outermembrane receptor protein
LSGPQTLYAGVLTAFGVPASAAIPAASGLKFSSQLGQTYDNERNGWQNGVLHGPYLPKSFLYNTDLVVSGNLKVSFEHFDFVSLSGYDQNVYNSAADVLDGDPASVPSFGLGAPSVGFAAQTRSDMISQDFQLVSTNTPIEWIVGASYFRESGPIIQSSDVFGFSSIIADTYWTDTAYSGFAQATIPFGRARLTVGGRYTSETYKLRDDIDTAATGVPNQGSSRRRDTKFTHDVRLDYRLTDATLAYASTSTGFKSGSLNPNNPVAGSAAPETITAYEIGLKSELYDRRLRVNAAVFYYDYGNIQLNVLVPGSSTFLVNGSGSHMKGAELEVDWIASNHLSLNFNATALDAKYRSDATYHGLDGAEGVLAIAGKQLVMAPKLAAAGGLDWTLFSVAGGVIKLSPSVRYTSGYWINSANQYGSGGGGSDKSFAVVNSDLSYSTNDGHWTGSLWVLNAFDVDYVRSGIDAAGGLTQAGTAGRPRQYGLRLGYRF